MPRAKKITPVEQAVIDTAAVKKLSPKKPTAPAAKKPAPAPAKAATETALKPVKRATKPRAAKKAAKGRTSPASRAPKVAPVEDVKPLHESELEAYTPLLVADNWNLPYDLGSCVQNIASYSKTGDLNALHQAISFLAHHIARKSL